MVNTESDWLYHLQPKMEQLYTVSTTRLGADSGSDHELLIAKFWFIFFFRVTAPFYLEDSRRIQDWKRRDWRSAWGGRKRERKRERESARACTLERESQRKRFDSSFYMFFLPPGPALCKLGLARSAVCSAWSFHSGPRTFLWPSLSFSHCHFGLLFPILPT